MYKANKSGVNKAVLVQTRVSLGVWLEITVDLQTTDIRSSGRNGSLGEQTVWHQVPTELLVLPKLHPLQGPPQISRNFLS